MLRCLLSMQRLIEHDSNLMIRPSLKYQTEMKKKYIQQASIFTANNRSTINVFHCGCEHPVRVIFPDHLGRSRGETLTCAGVAVGGRSGAGVSLSRRMARVQRLDDERLLVVRQSVDAAPRSQPPRHTGEVGPLEKKHVGTFSSFYKKTISPACQ